MRPSGPQMGWVRGVRVVTGQMAKARVTSPWMRVERGRGTQAQVATQVSLYSPCLHTSRRST